MIDIPIKMTKLKKFNSARADEKKNMLGDESFLKQLRQIYYSNYIYLDCQHLDPLKQPPLYLERQPFPIRMMWNSLQNSDEDDKELAKD